ncbi:hypothetical protein ACFOWM_00880 [Ferruginibacter yonginensis]|uniref:Uncharacterized protein n=1 Tax=Ferruginibacter yonginensis TaxID=1310416 RepID=A0ABV8QM82_9BACT
MQHIEPYFNWRHLYAAEEDSLSPFYERTYNEFQYTQKIYNYYIHPQWDEMGSSTLYMKALFVDYDQHYAIIELIGEWNDAIENDIMTFRRNITDIMYKTGIYKFILIGENVLNFHSSDDSYYEEWHEQIADEYGWITVLNFPEQSKHDFKKARITNYVEMLDLPQWRTMKPEGIFALIDKEMSRRLY